MEWNNVMYSSVIVFVFQEYSVGHMSSVQDWKGMVSTLAGKGF